MKRIIYYIIILLLSFNFVSAVDVCPGVPITMSWYSENTVGRTGSSNNPTSCYIDPEPSVSGSRQVTLQSGSCTVTFSGYQGTAFNQTASASANATLNVVNGPQCCGTGSQVGLTQWNGSTCVAPAAPGLTGARSGLRPGNIYYVGDSSGVALYPSNAPAGSYLTITNCGIFNNSSVTPNNYSNLAPARPIALLAKVTVV